MLRMLVVTIMACMGLFSQIQAGTAAQTGMASYYWQGRLTANGERYNPSGLSAAHRTLPFGTMVRVTMLNTGRSIVVRINDRGPFIRGRIIDLSRGAAARLGYLNAGVTRVSIEVVGRGTPVYASNKRARRTQYASARAKRRAVQLATARKARSAVYASNGKIRAVGGAKKPGRKHRLNNKVAVQY